MNHIIVLFGGLLIYSGVLNAQIKEYVLMKHEDQTKVYEKKGAEYVSNILIYSDNTFEFYFSSTGLGQKYTCGRITRENGDTVIMNSEMKQLNNKKLSLYNDERYLLYRFVNFKNIKLTVKGNEADMITPLNMRLSDPALGVPIDSLIKTAGFK